MNYRRYFLVLFSVIIGGSLSAQEIKVDVEGVVADANDQSSVVGATVLFINIKDSLRSKFAVTDIDGRFSIKKLEPAFYRITLSSVGYESFTKILRLNQPKVDLGRLSLKPDIVQLDAVSIEADVVPIEVKGDTTQYNAAAFKTNPDATTADLVSKMPGIIVDKSGVTANGEQVEQVLLDGKRFFGTDPLLSLTNIPAEIVDNVQVYDEASDQAQFTGFDDGNSTKTMNVVTKKDRRNGQFGRVYGGYGTDDRYSAGGVVNSFKDDQRISVLGMTNNVNIQNFSNQDLAGIGSGGGRRGGGSRGNGNATLNANQDGITTTNTAGINYSDKWGESTQIESNYFFNYTDNLNAEQVYRVSAIRDTEQRYRESADANTLNGNHRFNLRLDHKISDRANLLLRSSFGSQNNELEEKTQASTSNQLEELISSTDNTFFSENNALNINNSLTYQQKLSDIGRTFSITGNSTIRPIERFSQFQDINADSLLNYTTDEIRNSYGARFSFTEPVGNFSQLELGYRFDYNGRESDKETISTDLMTLEEQIVNGLSSEFTSGYTTHLPSVSFGYRNYDSFFRATASYQQARLTSVQTFPESFDQAFTFHNALFSVMGRIPVGNNGNLMLRYQSQTDEPSVNQLQSVVDYSNPLFLSVGNPNLAQAYTHQLISRYNTANPDKNFTFANFTSLNQTNNYIAESTSVFQTDTVLTGGVSAVRGTQLSKPVNLAGYWNVRNSTTVGKMISTLKSNINTTFSLAYTRLPGEVNSDLNFNHNYTAGLRLGIASNISENVDFNLFAGTSTNLVTTTLAETENSNFTTNTAGGKFNFIFGDGWVLRGNLSYLQYRGVSGTSDLDYTLLNMSMAKKLFKNKLGEIELSVFDLLKQNTSISQRVTNIFVQETATTVLQQYVMLNFSYQFRNFN